MNPEVEPIGITGGVVAFCDADRLQRAVESLTAQALPPGCVWERIWLVVSPSPDGTVELADQLARNDPRLTVVREPLRRGKSAALAEVLSRADTPYVVLLNGDAAAEPGSVAALLAPVQGERRRFAVMARPVPDPEGSTPLDATVELLWELHHDIHEVTLRDGTGTHLSDEMILVSGRDPPPLVPGIVSDGQFIGAWVQSGGGRTFYSPDARVRIAVPASLREYLVQRRRILLGNRLIWRSTGRPPESLSHRAMSDPVGTFRLIVDRVRHTPDGWTRLASLLSTELLARGLAAWDYRFHREPPVVWDRIRGKPWGRAAPPRREDAVA